MKHQSSQQSQDSCDSRGSSSSEGGQGQSGDKNFRVVILGSGGVGKTSILSRFLYDSFPLGYKETVDDIYRGDFTLDGLDISLTLQDTGGGYVDEFPAMVAVSLAQSDAAILVYSVNSASSFEEVSRLRGFLLETKGLENMPLVVVGNKTDLGREVPLEEAEALVMFDLENGYAECSARDNRGVTGVFQELLCKARNKVYDDGVCSSKENKGHKVTRRQSLPQVPAFQRLMEGEESPAASPKLGQKRRGSMGLKKRDSCKVQ